MMVFMQKKWLLLLLLISCAGLLFSAEPIISSFTLRGEMPKDQYFRVESSGEAENVDLTKARGSDIAIGRYRLFSNEGKASFQIIVRPGEDGSEAAFKLALDPGTPHAPGLETEIPFIVTLSYSEGSRVTTSEGSGVIAKSVDSRSRDSGSFGVQESGEIFAKIPNFDPTNYATGTYSAAIQFTVTTD